MEIPAITITFDTSAAEKALECLAQSALDSPDIVKGIAKMEGPLFNSAAREADYFSGDRGRVIEVALYPTEKLKQFLRGLGKIGTSTMDQPAIHAPRSG
jgi:hypothetical protein